MKEVILRGAKSEGTNFQHTCTAKNLEGDSLGRRKILTWEFGSLKRRVQEVVMG